MIALQTVLPYSVTRCLSLLERCLQRDEGVSPDLRTRLLTAIPIVRHVITVMHRCHLVAFYMNGLFYHMAKRIMAIYYVSKCSTLLLFFADFTAMVWVRLKLSWVLSSISLGPSILRVNFLPAPTYDFQQKLKRCVLVDTPLITVPYEENDISFNILVIVSLDQCNGGGGCGYMDQNRSP